MGKRFLMGAAVVLMAVSASAVTTKDTATGGVTAAQIAQLLTGAGITITNAKITGAGTAIGTFEGGNADGLSIATGVILSSGDIKTAAGPNTSEGTTGSAGGVGDASLDELIKPLKTRDAIVLEFDVVTVSPTFSIKYIFASEEYKEYVNSSYNDVFAFFVDGQNIALVPGGTEPVTINNINHKKNTGLFNDNPSGSNNFGTSFDGFTTELTALAAVSAGVPHHVKIALADVTDTILDSAVFLAAGGISGAGVATTVVPSVRQIVASNLEFNEMDIVVYGIPEGQVPAMTATGLPSDSTVTFSRVADAGLNTPAFRMKTTIGPNTPAGVYTLTVTATVPDASASANVNVIVDCTPPIILSLPTSQPQSTTVASGGRATLRVVAAGTSAFQYQWYVGHTGATNFPIAGGTSATLTTPAITAPTEFWVRVYNPCGSVDSLSAVVTPTGSGSVEKRKHSVD